MFSIEEKEKIEFLKSRLLSYQYSQKNSQQEGAFFYNKDQSHLNSWCTMFGLQALAFYDNKDFIFSSKKIDLLI
jgi:hypothetical protein